MARHTVRDESLLALRDAVRGVFVRPRDGGNGDPGEGGEVRQETGDDGTS